MENRRSWRGTYGESGGQEEYELVNEREFWD